MGNELDIILILMGSVSFGALVGLWLRSYLRRHPASLGFTPPPPDRDVEIARIHSAERAEARALYERLVRERLDVLKTAVTMGYGKQELAELDARLEQLIGSDKLQQLLTDPAVPPPPPGAALLDVDLTLPAGAAPRRAGERQQS